MESNEAICTSTRIPGLDVLTSWPFTNLAPRCSTQVRGVQGLNLSSPVADFRVIAVQSPNSCQNTEFLSTFSTQKVPNKISKICADWDFDFWYLCFCFGWGPGYPNNSDYPSELWSQFARRAGGVGFWRRQATASAVQKGWWKVMGREKKVLKRENHWETLQKMNFFLNKEGAHVQMFRAFKVMSADLKCFASWNWKFGSTSPAACVVPGVQMWRWLVWVRVWSVARASDLEIRELLSKRYVQVKVLKEKGHVPTGTCPLLEKVGFPAIGWESCIPLIPLITPLYKLLAWCFPRCNCTGPGIASCNEGWFCVRCNSAPEGRSMPSCTGTVRSSRQWHLQLQRWIHRRKVRCLSSCVPRYTCAPSLPKTTRAFRNSFQGAMNASSTSTIWRMVSRTSCIFVGGIRSETDAQSQILILTFLRRSRLCRWAISDAKDALSIVIQMITAAAMELEAKIDRTSHALAESAGVGKHWRAMTSPRNGETTVRSRYFLFSEWKLCLKFTWCSLRSKNDLWGVHHRSSDSSDQRMCLSDGMGWYESWGLFTFHRQDFHQLAMMAMLFSRFFPNQTS